VSHHAVCALVAVQIHTPDSSRYWLAASYESRLSAGQEPQNIDKEFLRLWFRERCDPYNDKVSMCQGGGASHAAGNKVVVCWRLSTSGVGARVMSRGGQGSWVACNTWNLQGGFLGCVQEHCDPCQRQGERCDPCNVKVSICTKSWERVVAVLVGGGTAEVGMCPGCGVISASIAAKGTEGVGQL
jgi:hypothetical protein